MNYDKKTYIKLDDNFHKMCRGSKCDKCSLNVDDGDRIIACELAFGYEQGRLEERQQWQQAAGEMIIKYNEDISEALPVALEQARKDTIDEIINMVKEMPFFLTTADIIPKLSDIIKENKYV